MASYRKLKSGWKVTVSKRVNGELKQISKNGFATKAEARLWGAQMEADTDTMSDAAIPFTDYFWSWYETYKAPKLAQLTCDKYMTIHKSLCNWFGKQKLSSITRADYQHYINQFGSCHAKDTVYKYHSVIKACVKSAVLDELIAKNFTDGIELVYNAGRSIDVEYLEIDELKKLTKATATNFDPHYTTRYIIYTAIFTGMRLGEILALTWNDVDFKNHTIDINKSWDYIHHTGFKPVKTSSSKRVIKVNQELLNALGALKLNGYEMVFENQFRTIPSPTAIRKMLLTLLAECNIHRKNFHFHSLRHTHVAYLLYCGVDLYGISKRLGHSDMTITARKYSYLLSAYSEKLDNQITGALSLLS